MGKPKKDSALELAWKKATALIKPSRPTIAKIWFTAGFDLGQKAALRRGANRGKD